MSTAIINVLFSSMKGSKYPGQLRGDFTLQDIRDLVKARFGSENFRLVVGGKEIQDQDATSFAETKKTIKNNTVIYVCQTMKGGSCMIDMDTHRGTILNALEDELPRMTEKAQLSECMICNEQQKCIRFCCGSIICKECFSNYFLHKSFRLSCLRCDKYVSPENVFITTSFIDALNEKDETEKMTRNIDFQICTCGIFSINTTMYARQQCNNCQRWLCFFCNADWNEQGKGMRNEQYSCRVNCYWETKLTYQLVPLEYNKEMKVPNRRCCPKCFEVGAYDKKCKYHTCGCGHVFCFVCLEPKEQCESQYKSAYNKPCTKLAQQSYAIFPRLCH